MWFSSLDEHRPPHPFPIKARMNSGANLLLPEDIKKLVVLGLSPDQILGVSDLVMRVTKRNEKRNNVTSNVTRYISDGALRQKRYRENKKLQKDSKEPVTFMLCNDVTGDISSLLSSLPNQVKKEKIKKESISPEFENFMSAYPSRRGSISKALQSYQRVISRGVSHESLIDGARAYAAFVNAEGTELQFVCHAVTWLNQRRWESDYSIQKPRPQRTIDKSDLARAAADKGFDELVESGFFRPARS